MDVERRRVWIHTSEVVDSLVVKEAGKIRYYSHTYRIKNVRGRWRPSVRWDIRNGQPHVDKYDEIGGLLESKNSRRMSLHEVVGLVKIYRKGLRAMELAQF